MRVKSEIRSEYYFKVFCTLLVKKNIKATVQLLQNSPFFSKWQFDCSLTIKKKVDAKLLNFRQSFLRAAG